MEKRDEKEMKDGGSLGGGSDQDISQVGSAHIWDDLPKHLKNKKKTTYIRNHSDLKMASRTVKIQLLLWKNWLVMKRRWKMTCLEMITPILAIAILTFVVSLWEEEPIKHMKYTTFGIKTNLHCFKNCSRFVFIPNIPIIEEIMTGVKLEMNLNTNYKFELMTNTEELEESKKFADLCAAIVFTFKRTDLLTPMTHFPEIIDYTIRMPAVHQDKGLDDAAGGFLSRGAQWDTYHLFPNELVTGPRNADDETGGSPGYFYHGFLYLQNLVAEKVTRKIFITGYSMYANVSDAESSFDTLIENILVKLGRFPYPANKEEQMIVLIHDVLPLTIVISYCIPFMLIIYGAVVEKESGIRIQMKTLDIPITYHRMTWIARCLLLHTIPAIAITGILCTNWTFKKMGILTFTRPEIFFLLMMAFIFKTVAISMLLVTLFRRASTATASCGFLWVVSYVPYYYVKENYNTFTFIERIFSCLLGNIGISMGCHLLSDAEARGVEINWENLFVRKEFTVGWVIVVLVSVGLAEIFISQYINRILPEKGITPLPWNYFFKMWYWRKQLPPDEHIIATQYMLNSQSLEEKLPENFEKESHIRRRKELQVDKITKYYGSDRVLNKINLNCYEGYLTAIIGERGSGKSTLLSIISGGTPMTKGSVIVSRQDMEKQMRVAKAFVGFCPSQNVMYPYLTVEETLTLYCKLKCIRSGLEQWDEVERYLEDAMLEDYRYALASELSSSAKRMLMVACAFIGGSRVVVIDNPVRQMNSSQKRMAWDFISKQKKHRTIIVAMETMNEADLVADRIVVLQHGEATCSGSPRFMQLKYSGGYHLILEKGDPCDVKSISELVKRRIPDSDLVDESETELNFFLPEESSEAFQYLFEEIEKKAKSLGVTKTKSYFITMDEVLMNIKRIAMETDYDPENRKAIYQGVKEVSVSNYYKRLTGCLYAFLQFKLMLMKNYRFNVRRTKVFIATSIVPLLFTLLCCCVLIFKPFDLNLQPLTFNLEPYDNPNIMMDCFDSSYEGIFLCRHLKNTLKSTFKVPPSRLIELKRETIQDVVLQKYLEHVRDNEIPLIGVEIKSNVISDSNVEITGFFNNQPLHTPPVVLSVIDNAILDYMLGALTSYFPKYTKDRGFSTHIFQVTNLPLPYTPADKVKFSGIFISSGFFLGVALSTGYSFLVASFVVLEVHEKAFKHLQMLAGANSFLFWAANYLFSFAHFTVISAVTCLIVWLFEIPGFKLKQFYLLFILLESYGLCSVFFIGAWSLVPVAHWGLAFSRTFLLLILTGPMFMLLTIALSDPTAHAGFQTISSFHNMFMCFPNYAMGVGVFYIIANSIHVAQCKDVEILKNPGACNEPHQHPRHIWNEFERGHNGEETLWSCCNNKKINDFDFIAYGIGRNLMTMLVVLLISLCIRVMKETAIWTKFKKCWINWEMRKWEKFESFEHEIYDYDVLNEALRVFHGNTANDLVIKNLTKILPGVRKVDNLCIEIDKGQCFCLLGVSGAGKSAALNMIVGTKLPTSGDVSIHGVSLMNEYPKYIKHIGYCPDVSPFLKELTGHETLTLIGALRRIPSDHCDRFITNLSLRLLFLHDLDNQIKSYNAVSVRKLSAAVAMLGDPEVVVFDEPTNSIDLVSREYLFKSINALTEKGSIAIVTSNSVAECETICTKMAIMVNGTLRCFGTPQHLRELFSEGFTIIVKFTLDPKKAYFTTQKDKFRIHERRINDKEPAELPRSQSVCQRKYHEDEVRNRQSMRVSITNLTLFPERSGQVHIKMGEEEPEIILSTWEEDLVPFISYFERNFPDSILVDKQPGFVHYHIRQGRAKASQLFSKMEEAKVLVSQIESYYVGQSNLDQVFLNFARGQRPYE